MLHSLRARRRSIWLLPLFLVIFILPTFTSVTARAGQSDVLMVTNTNDSGPGSLRQALADAQDGDTILIDIANSPSRHEPQEHKIDLTSSITIVQSDLLIKPAETENDEIVLDIANIEVNKSRHLVNYGSVTIEGLVFRNGRAQGGPEATDGWGGSILNFGTFRLERASFLNNSARYGGGAIYNAGVVIGDQLSGYGNSVVDENDVLQGSGGFIMNVAQNEGNSAVFMSTGGELLDNKALVGGAVQNAALNGASAEVTMSEYVIKRAHAHTGAFFANEVVNGGTAEFSLENSAVCLNQAEFGGVGSNSGVGAIVNMTNVTAYKNEAAEAGTVIANANGGQTNIAYATLADNVHRGGDNTAVEAVHNFDPGALGGGVSASASIFNNPTLEFSGPNINNGGFNVANDDSGFDNGDDDSLVVEDIALGPYGDNGGNVDTMLYLGPAEDFLNIPQGSVECGLNVYGDARGVLRPQQVMNGQFCNPGAAQQEAVKFVMIKDVPEAFANGAPEFEMGALFGAPLSISLIPGQMYTADVFPVAEVLFGERLPPGWTLDSVRCWIDDVEHTVRRKSQPSEKLLVLSLVLDPQPKQRVACTLINTKANTVVVKKVTNTQGPETARFVTSPVADYLTGEAKSLAHGDTWTIDYIPAGKFYVGEEEAPFGLYELTAIECEGAPHTVGAFGVSFDFEEDKVSSAECTFYNEWSNLDNKIGLPALFGGK